MKSNLFRKKLIAFIVLTMTVFTFSTLSGCVSSSVGPNANEPEDMDSTAAPQATSQPQQGVPTSAPARSQNVGAGDTPTTVPIATGAALESITSTPNVTTTRIVQTPRILATPTFTRTPMPMATPANPRAATPTRTPTPTAIVTNFAIQEQMSERAFRLLMAAFDSGEIRQEEGCLPVPEMGNMKAEVLRETRRDVDSESYSLSNFALPYILLLDIESIQPRGFFESTYLFGRDDELPGISSRTEVVALINVCAIAKIPTGLKIESQDATWTLYIVTAS